MFTIDELFQERVEEVISTDSGCTLYFFKGFAVPQIRYLINHTHSILNAPELLRNDELDVEVLNEKWIDIIMSIRCAKEPLVGFYEELLLLQDDLAKLRVDRVVVIENNILAPWIPSCIPWNQVLRLFDYQQAEFEVKDNLLKTLTQFYGDVKLLEHQQALLLPVVIDYTMVENISFWKDGEYEFDELSCDITIEIGSKADWEYRLQLLLGKRESALFLQRGDGISKREAALVSALVALDIEFVIDDVALYEEKLEYDGNQFLPLLKKYWGKEAAFRPLLFYKDPDRSHETEEISQGQIISEIVEQCELATDGDPYSNVFITAPTGAGKSILFQLPALYLAEKYNLVTIVVSPLIALMNDQVDQLQREHGISIAACINSAMTMDERFDTIEQICAGKKSLLYLAPELLLTTNLQTFLGGRKVGLVVIDEAHTVTSWGRDFRSDYWFLGDFLKKAKRNGLRFPVLCLTATAVYSGEDDVVNDTINELGLERTIIHLGNVKRSNIAFDICRHQTDKLTEKVESVKMDLTLKHVRYHIANGEKVLTYFPYRSHVDQIYSMIEKEEHRRIRRYHGQVPAPERKLVELDYKSGETMGLFCTKAFGMGIDVGDIKHVIHFAPTGTLADYVQEVGRAARNPNIQGIAHIDYFPSDLRYVRALNGISEMRQFQLREMLKKLCEIYSVKKRRNLLISSETFEYLFEESDVENRTKSGLMLLAKDLANKYAAFPVLIVRPKAMLSKNYIYVPAELSEQFLSKYAQYAKLQFGTTSRIELSRNRAYASDVSISSAGQVYLVDMARLWEECYPDRSFGMFKRNFFETEYIVKKQSFFYSPRVKVEIHYKDDFSRARERVRLIIAAIVDIFGTYKNAEHKQFTQAQFEADMLHSLGEKIVAKEKMAMLLDIFTANVDEHAVYSQVKNQVRVLQRRKVPGADETGYFVRETAYDRLNSYFARYLEQCTPEQGCNAISRFYPLIQNRPIEIMPLLRLLELLDLASYEIRGGEKAEVFVRINDPAKLQRLASGNYTNHVLRSIRERHQHNHKLLSAFFMAEMSTEARWELIEQYFLGNEAYVAEVLRLPE